MDIRHLVARSRETPDPGAWIVPDKLLVRSYPRHVTDLITLANLGIRTVINLASRAHDPRHLERAGIQEAHIPVQDFRPPSLEQIERGIATIDAALARGECVAVHCDAGLGRSGTLVACYLVHQGVDAGSAIAEVRSRRPGAIETRGQQAAIHAYARHLGQST